MKDKIQAAFEKIQADEALKYGTAVYLSEELKRRKNANQRLRFTKRTGAFAAVAATVFIAAMFSYSLYFVPDAHVSIDINPSVELTLNKLDKVIATHAFNEDGERLLSEINLRGQRYDAAAELILSRIEADGYFAEDALVSVTVQAAGGKENLLCSALRRLLGERKLPNAADVEVFPVSEEIWSHAHGDNVSPAKYLAIQELLEVDEEATIQDYDDSTIPMIRQRTQECRNAHGMMANSGEAASNSSHGGHRMGGYMHGSGHGGR